MSADPDRASVRSPVATAERREGLPSRLHYSFGEIALQPTRASWPAPRVLPIQKKLRAGSVADPLEAESDRVAAFVSGPSWGNANSVAVTPLAASSSTHTEVPDSVPRTLSSGGMPLDHASRRLLEPRFGHSFANVRVHHDRDAAASADDVGARAYTVGNHIVFGAHEFAPSTAAGRSLLAHELSHTLQQSRSPGLLQRKPKTKAEADFYKSKEWKDYQQSFRDLQEIKRQVAEAQQHLKDLDDPVKKRAFDQKVTDAQAKLDSLKSQRVVKQAELTVANSERDRTAKVAEEATKRAEEAAAKAAASRKSARVWTRIAAGVALVGHTLETVVSCPLAETGIGAVGCIHGLTSMYADSKSVTSGEPEENAFHQTGRQVAELAGAGPRVSNFVGDATDAGGGFASGVAAIRATPPRPYTGGRSAPSPEPVVEPVAEPAAEPVAPRATEKLSPGTKGDRVASAKALGEREAAAAPGAPLPAAQQAMARSLLEEHPNLTENVANDSVKGAAKVAGKGVKGADVILINGGGREVSVHTGAFSPAAVGSHLLEEAAQAGTTEVYLQMSGGTRQGLLEMIPTIRNGYNELAGVYVKFFGPDGSVWWNGKFGGLR